jgi:hypothetical protein
LAGFFVLAFSFLAAGFAAALGAASFFGFGAGAID